MTQRGEAADGLIEITVEDTGVGISDQDLPRVFDPFFTTKSHGTGLGLAVAHSIISDQGGTIVVESRPGQGTTFSMDFPLIRKEGPS